MRNADSAQGGGREPVSLGCQDRTTRKIFDNAGVNVDKDLMYFGVYDHRYIWIVFHFATVMPTTETPKKQSQEIITGGY